VCLHCSIGNCKFVNVTASKIAVSIPCRAHSSIVAAVMCHNCSMSEPSHHCAKHALQMNVLHGSECKLAEPLSICALLIH